MSHPWDYERVFPAGRFRTSSGRASTLLTSSGTLQGMTTYRSSDWARLGQAVHEARVERGLSKTREWAAATGRSDRTLLELERGGKVGTSTLEAIEDALGWPRAGAFRVLGGLPWREVADGPGPTAAGESDDLLAAIGRIERRLDDIERRLKEAGDGDADAAAERGGPAPIGAELSEGSTTDDYALAADEQGEIAGEQELHNEP